MSLSTEEPVRLFHVLHFLRRGYYKRCLYWSTQHAGHVMSDDKSCEHRVWCSEQTEALIQPQWWDCRAFLFYYFYIFSRFIMRRTFQWLHNTNQPFLELTSLSCSSSQFSRILLSHLPTKAPSQSLKKIAASGGSKPRRSRPCQVLHLKTRLLLNQRWII